MSKDEELERIKEEMLRRMMAPRDTGPLAEGEVTELNSSNFKEALNKAGKPILVDFWAAWCGPCMMMKPVLESMARDYSGKAFFAKVDVDRNQGLARQFGVMSIPNFVLFNRGRPVERVVGAVGRAGLEAALGRHISQ